MQRQLGNIILLGLSVLVVAAQPVRAENPTFTLTMKDHAFSPADLTIPARVKVLLIVKNLDSTPSEFESDDFHREKIVTGSSEIRVFVGPLLEGKYEFFDDFHPTTRGHLIVK
jgi:hypothetical protein